VSESVSKNKKALVDFEVVETFEAGIKLLGPEVKSIKGHDVNLKGSFIDSDNSNQLWVNGMHVSPYKFARDQVINPTRKRLLLLNKKEISKIIKSLNEKGVTCVPLELYLKGGLIKMKLAIVKGKKKYDRRDELKKKSQNMDIARALRSHYK